MQFPTLRALLCGLYALGIQEHIRPIPTLCWLSIDNAIIIFQLNIHQEIFEF